MSARMLSVTEFAARERVTRTRVLQLLATGRITGATRAGCQWAIPEAARFDRRPAGRPRSPKCLIDALARKYIWWERAEVPDDLVIAQVLTLGDWVDARRLEKALGRARLARALRRAEAGRFLRAHMDLLASSARPRRGRCRRAPDAEAPVRVIATLTPRLERLPPSQRRLWPRLQPSVALGWVRSMICRACG